MRNMGREKNDALERCARVLLLRSLFLFAPFLADRSSASRLWYGLDISLDFCPLLEFENARERRRYSMSLKIVTIISLNKMAKNSKIKANNFVTKWAFQKKIHFSFYCFLFFKSYLFVTCDVTGRYCQNRKAWKRMEVGNWDPPSAP